MSEFLLIFTMVILSPDKIILTMEKVNLVSKTSLEIQQFQFENTEVGFSAADREQKRLRKDLHLPASDCLVVLNKEKKGFIHVGLSHLGNLPEAANITEPNIEKIVALCRMKKAKF
ncbi:hypothetical protein LEP1GSC195_0279 [Leptospira wolbachii serovar Codice str. CDC]|uniref:Uncharacterized protein n=1 Tax=Leptospira wolbachii serovar Codice str. CDC TaxID=1218599 RepID=R9A620_9LEPT|nr:hypothetical protein [Leptospira wolbachii]EOQ97552.1 hypothetical protein LEP1GSC195_0279 [Leptospira wolbachii serovar Codice str. CDC]